MTNPTPQFRVRLLVNEDSVDSDVADVPSSQSESAIWENARSGFKNFIPRALEECWKNKSFLRLPGGV